MSWCDTCNCDHIAMPHNASPCYLAKGDHITITSQEAGTSHGRVIEAIAPALLPDLPIPLDLDTDDAAELCREYGTHIADAEIVRLILNEWGVRQVAAITHQHAGRKVIFVALGDGAGRWRDLLGAELSITPTLPPAV